LHHAVVSIDVRGMQVACLERRSTASTRGIHWKTQLTQVPVLDQCRLGRRHTCTIRSSRWRCQRTFLELT